MMKSDFFMTHGSPVESGRADAQSFSVKVADDLF
jgi:hypothetical protein